LSLKVAIVGCGKIADGHVEEIAKMPELASVVAVCDREPLMAEQLAFRFGVARHYGDYEALLAREKPDVVHITTPPQSHLELATRAIEAGAHVYVEKPLTIRHADSERLVERAERAARHLGIGYTYLFDPPAEAMRELVAQGVLGSPVHVESTYGYDLSGSFGHALLADPKHWVHGLPGGLLHNNIDHVLNKVVEFLDDDRPSVSVEGWVRRQTRFGDARDRLHDELRILLRGREVSAYGTFSCHARPPMHLQRVYGTANTLHVDFVGRTVTLEPAPRWPGAIGRLQPAFSSATQYGREGFQNVWRFARSDFHFFAGLNRLFRLFFRSILDGKAPPISHRDILRVSWLMDEVFARLRPEERP
jgi:predicted dehydrogenase